MPGTARTTPSRLASPLHPALLVAERRPFPSSEVGAPRAGLELAASAVRLLDLQRVGGRYEGDRAGWPGAPAL